MSIFKPALAIFGVLSVFMLAACQTGSNNATPAAGPETAMEGPVEGSQAAVKTITIPAGTTIQVRLVDSVSSARSHVGESFLATLDQPIVVNDWVAVPQGANITGRVIEAQPSGHLKTPAALAITLTALQAEGKTYEIKTSNYSVRAKSHSHRNVEWIGSSAAGGALVGKGRGAAIGAAVGAGGGTAAAYTTGQKDILLPSETRLRLVLQEPVTITKAG